MIGSGTNALASSVVLVCNKRTANAESISRRQFIRELNRVLPEALDEMTRGQHRCPGYQPISGGAGGLVASHYWPRYGHLQ